MDVLPDEILLKIFSYLSAEDVRQNISLLNRRYYSLTKDTLLWRQLLNKACNTWSFISHSTHPDLVHKELEKLSESNTLNVSPREIYIQCSAYHRREISDDFPSSVEDYDLREMMKSTFVRLAPKRLSNIVFPDRSYSPKFSIIGPGLNSDIFNIMPEIMKGRGILKMVGVFPGSHEFPFSSGMSYDLEIGATETIRFDLIMLYSAGHTQRTSTFMEGEYSLSPPLYETNLSDPSNTNTRVSEQLKAHLGKQKGLIFVVDANMSDKLFERALLEIKLLAEMSKHFHIPVLIFSVIRDVNFPRHRSAFQVSQLLHLVEYLGDTVPWRVQDVICSGMWHFVEGFIWLHQQSRMITREIED